MDTGPLAGVVLFRVGPIPVGAEVVTTWGIILVLVCVSFVLRLRLTARPGRLQIALEAIIEMVNHEIAAITGRDPNALMPLLATLFLFVAAANLCGVLPGIHAPTARIETPAALALIVFGAVHFYGIRAQRPAAYLRSYLKPSPLLLPLNVLSEITRTFALMIRLFGNMMSHEFLIAIVITLAGLLVPIPFMALGILIGLIQAYIFTVLATVFIAAGLGTTDAR